MQIAKQFSLSEDRSVFLYLFGALVLFVAPFVGLVLARWPSAGSLGDSALWGDFLGGHLSPIVGLLSTVLFVAALLLQQRELREARSIASEQKEQVRQQVHVTEIVAQLDLFVANWRHYMSLDWSDANSRHQARIFRTQLEDDRERILERIAASGLPSTIVESLSGALGLPIDI